MLPHFLSNACPCALGGEFPRLTTRQRVHRAAILWARSCSSDIRAARADIQQEKKRKGSSGDPTSHLALAMTVRLGRPVGRALARGLELPVVLAIYGLP